MRAAVLMTIGLTSAFVASAQSPGVVATGFNSVPYTNVGLGQIVTFPIAGLSPNQSSASASALPLPLKLAGLSALAINPDSGQQIAVPLVSVLPGSNCFIPTYPQAQCGPVSMVTVQIPYELTPSDFLLSGPPFTDLLAFSDEGGHTASIAVHVVVDQIQILGVTNVAGQPAFAVHPGDIVIFYASGLGRTDPLVATGTAPSAPVSMLAYLPLVLNFDFHVNAQPIKPVLAPYGDPPDNPLYSRPLFAGLIPGYAGLYQINVQIPAIPSGLPACDFDVGSNLTITLIGTTSFAGTAFCVSPQ